MKYLLSLLLVCGLGVMAFAQSPRTVVRVETVRHGAIPSLYSNIPADAPSRKFTITSDSPSIVCLASEFYEDDRLARVDTKLYGDFERRYLTRIYFKG